MQPRFLTLTHKLEGEPTVLLRCDAFMLFRQNLYRLVGEARNFLSYRVECPEMAVHGCFGKPGLLDFPAHPLLMKPNLLSFVPHGKSC